MLRTILSSLGISFTTATGLRMRKTMARPMPRAKLRMAPKITSVQLGP